jgi:hypothetical protein
LVGVDDAEGVSVTFGVSVASGVSVSAGRGVNVGRGVRLGVAVGGLTRATNVPASQASSTRVATASPKSPIKRLLFKYIYLHEDRAYYTLLSANGQNLGAEWAETAEPGSFQSSVSMTNPSHHYLDRLRLRSETVWPPPRVLEQTQVPPVVPIYPILTLGRISS